jgi:hypothetical protein
MRDSRTDAFAWLLKVETAIKKMNAPACADQGECVEGDEALSTTLHLEGVLANLFEKYYEDGYMDGVGTRK